MTVKFSNFGTMPTPYQDELLTILMEECAEITQRASKAKRFGIDEKQPGDDRDNLFRMTEEIGDLFCVVERLRKEGLFLPDVAEKAMIRKDEKLKKYMRYDQS